MAFVKPVLKILAHAFFMGVVLSYNLWASSAQVFLPDFFYAFLFLSIRREHLSVFVVYFILNGLFRHQLWGQNVLILACEGMCLYVAFEVEKLWLQKGFLGALASFSLFQFLFFALHGFPLKYIRPLHLLFVFLFYMICLLFDREEEKNEFF